MAGEHGSSFRARTHRRSLLVSAAALAFPGSAGSAHEIKGRLPWHPGASAPPEPVHPGPWLFFTPEEGAAVEAIVDRLIPPDERGPGGKDAGCATFIDSQLAGPYGRSEGLYMRPPFMDGTPEQGIQSAATPAEHYRNGLAALTGHCRAAYVGKSFNQLPAAEQDRLLTAMEKGELRLPGIDVQSFFELVLKNTVEGFFADPIYGGNRDLCGWKLIGFPGVRYDYRDWVERHNERYPLPPVGIGGRAEWHGRG